VSGSGQRPNNHLNGAGSGSREWRHSSGEERALPTAQLCARALCDTGLAFTQRGSGGHVPRLKHKQRGNRRISPQGKLASGNTALEARVDRGTVTRPNHDAELSLLIGPIAMDTLPTTRRPVCVYNGVMFAICYAWGREPSSQQSRRSLLLTLRLFSASRHARSSEGREGPSGLQSFGSGKYLKAAISPRWGLACLLGDVCSDIQVYTNPCGMFLCRNMKPWL